MVWEMLLQEQLNKSAELYPSTHPIARISAWPWVTPVLSLFFKIEFQSRWTLARTSSEISLQWFSAAVRPAVIGEAVLSTSIKASLWPEINSKKPRPFLFIMASELSTWTESLQKNLTHCCATLLAITYFLSVFIMFVFCFGLEKWEIWLLTLSGF